ncbi:hypothetical protein BH20ACT22_BH20ACT22_11380 [soil metagenome]
MTRADAGSAGQAPPAGHQAPDFTLPSSVGDPVTLKELRPHGVIRWSHVFEKGVTPGADGMVDALERIERG